MTQTKDKTYTLAICLSCQEAESIIEVEESLIFLPPCRTCGESGLYTIDEFAKLVPMPDAWLADALANLDADYWV